MTDSATTSDGRAERAAAFLIEHGFGARFDCAVVLGTGLGELADDLEHPVSIDYARIPHFPEVGVSGHGGRLVAGGLERKRVLVFQGRAHYYETGDAAAMRVPIGVVRALGAPPLLLTNAAGSTRPDCPPRASSPSPTTSICRARPPHRRPQRRALRFDDGRL
jgi:purine-nucleoside phosphorylase